MMMRTESGATPEAPDMGSDHVGRWVHEMLGYPQAARRSWAEAFPMEHLDDRERIVRVLDTYRVEQRP